MLISFGRPSGGKPGYCVSNLTSLAGTAIPKSSGCQYEPRSSMTTHQFHHADWNIDIQVLERRTAATEIHPACIIPKDWMWQPVWCLQSHMHKKKSHQRRANAQMIQPVSKTNTTDYIDPYVTHMDQKMIPRASAGQQRRRIHPKDLTSLI